jgi:hypothetical protein
MIVTHRFLQILAAFSALLLSGCMGAPIAQQLLSSALMHGADNIMQNAYQSQQRQTFNQRSLKDSVPDPYWASFVSAGFQEIKPVEEPLPATIENADEIAAPDHKPNVSPFVRVEFWNMLIGEEKISVLQQAYIAGVKALPPREQWHHVRVATGAMPDNEQQPIMFLVPPELGRLNSGQETIVELGNDGGFNVARYTAN